LKRMSEQKKIEYMTYLVVNSISTTGNCEQALRTFKKRFPHLTKLATTTYMDDALDQMRLNSKQLFFKTRPEPRVA
jgi:hypothetical protein